MERVPEGGPEIRLCDLTIDITRCPADALVSAPTLDEELADGPDRSTAVTAVLIFVARRIRSMRPDKPQPVM